MKPQLHNVRVLVVLLFLTGGCFGSPVHTVQPLARDGPCLSALPESDLLIGLAVSGGGSRAALFAAGGFEALAALRVGSDGRSLLDRVSVISSVSGGSLASAYYTLKKPSQTVPILSSDGTLSPEYRQFFAEFKQAMSVDYEGPLLRRQIFRLRWFNPAWTAKSLSEILKEDYLGDATFSRLNERESAERSPRLLLNTTLYNSGRRFILSTIPADESRFDFISALPPVEPARAENAAVNDALRGRWESLLSLTPQDLQFDHCRIPIATVVAASMSFPPIIGPITFHIKDQDLYWHAGDGGLSDNTGIESLAMIFMKKIREGKARRALIIALDSSFPFDVGGERLNHFAEGFTLFNYDYSRIPTIMEERATAYRALFFNLSQQQGLLPASSELLIVTARHTETRWNEDLSDLPETCRKEEPPLSAPKAVIARLAKIVTRLWLDSPCERDLVLTAAKKIVTQKESTIRAFLER